LFLNQEEAGIPKFCHFARTSAAMRLQLKRNKAGPIATASKEKNAGADEKP
jgi:hypothetical protein